MDTRESTVTGGRMVTRELAEWVAGLGFDDLPTTAVDEAGLVLVDFLGECLFVGATQPWGRSIASFCASEGGRPEATIIASGEKTTAARAAMANGTMALGFEFADWGVGSRYYPFCVTGPLAVAESRHRSGKDLTVAIVLGYQVMANLLRATKKGIGPGQGVLMQAGAFYSPAVYGTVAAAAGSARVLGLDARLTNAAIGLGAAFAGGTFQGHEEGAWQRSLNGGMASERGVTAALLAQTDFKATEMGLEGVQGFAVQFYGGNLDADTLLAGLGSEWVINDRWSKAYPMNVTLHAPVEALVQIMQEHALTHDDIEEIDAAWQRVEEFLAKPEVSSIVSAQASLYFALALASVRGRPTVDDFTEETLHDPTIRSMIDRITVHQDTELYKKTINSMPGGVTVRTKDGRTFSAEVLFPKGNANNRMTADEYKAKFMRSSERVLGTAQAEELYERARNLAAIDDLAELTRLFGPAN